MQYINFQKVNSFREHLICGVSQSSILGPLVFMLYVNNLHRALKDSYYIVFADDTNALSNIIHGILSLSKRLRKQFLGTILIRFASGTCFGLP